MFLPWKQPSNLTAVSFQDDIPTFLQPTNAVKAYMCYVSKPSSVQTRLCCEFYNTFANCTANVGNKNMLIFRKDLLKIRWRPHKNWKVTELVGSFSVANKPGLAHKQTQCQCIHFWPTGNMYTVCILVTNFTNSSLK